MLSSLLLRLKGYLTGAAVFVALFFTVRAKMRSDAKKEAKREYESKALKQYARRRKAIDHAAPVDSDANNARERLRRRQARNKPNKS